MNANATLSPNATSLYLTFRQNAGKDNDVGISTMRQNAQLNGAEFDAALTELRRAGILTCSAADRYLTSEEASAAYVCPVSGEAFHYCHKRQS